MGQVKRIRLRIVGVPCASCVIPIRKKLERTPGIKWIGANVVLDLLFVDHDPEAINSDAIIAAIKEAGYTAVPEAR